VAPSGLLTAAGLLAAGVFVAVAAAAAMAGTGELRTAFGAVTVAAVLVAVGGVLATFAGLAGPVVAAILLPVVLSLGFLTPAIAAAMAGLKILPMPVSPAEFQQDIDPEPAGPLLDRTASADAFITGLFAALGVVCTGCLVILAGASGRSPALLVVAASVLVLLHSRELVGARQRVAMLAPGVLGPLALILIECQAGSAGFRLTALLCLLALALLGCAAARVLPGRRLLPHWGLAGDIAHWVTAAAIIPLALSATGTFTLVQGLWS
jgi:type VII secretion integral membrane protein EccD